MATQSNLKIFLGGFVKVLHEQWQVDLYLKAGNTKKGEVIPVHKLVMVLNEQWQVDLYLKAGNTKKGEVFPVHKLVMAARSEVFKRMLESDKFKASDKKIETVTLSELKHEQLEALIEFIYDNGSMLSEKEKKHVQSLYIAADKYDIPHLRDLCRNELISSLKLSNVLNIVELSLIPLDKTLYESAVRFIISNLETLCDSAEFKVFVGKNPDLSVEIVKASFTGTWNGHDV